MKDSSNKKRQTSPRERVDDKYQEFLFISDIFAIFARDIHAGPTTQIGGSQRLKTRDMTLQQLEYILALNRLGNFAKAADYCDVTQPTLSSMIQKLENELGIKIFDRRRQPIVTTKAGQAVIRQAKEVLYQSRRLREIVEEEKDTYLGTFTIGVLPTIAPYLIPHFFPQLMREHPEMDLRIVEMKTKDMKQALLNGDIDAGILAKIEGLEMFNSTHLYTEKYFAYISENDPLFVKERIKTTDLNGEFLWLLDEGHCFRDQLVKFCHLKSAAVSKKAYTLGSIETFMRIVENGKGVTFIPEMAISQLEDSQKRLVRPFALPEPRREIVMITADNFIRHKMLDMIVKRIQDCAKPLLCPNNK